MNFSKESIIGIVGAGAMGSGIAQVAATSGHKVIVYDVKEDVVVNAEQKLVQQLKTLEAKGKIENAASIIERITFVNDLKKLSDCHLIIEAIIENLDIKK